MINKIKNRIKQISISRWDRPVPLSPDGERYWAMGGGSVVCRPFYYRWLMPLLCKQSQFRWRMISELSVFLLIPASAFMLWCYGIPLYGCIVGCLAVMGLSGVWSFNKSVPVLVDAPAMLSTVLAVSFSFLDWHFWPIAIMFSVLAGCIKETSPIFASAIAWNPVLLFGLIAPLIKKIRTVEGEDVCLIPDAIFAIHHPYQAGMKSHMHEWTDWRIMIAPWGGLLLASFAISLPLVVSVLLAYAMLLIATDTVRLYQWSWPAMLIAAFSLPSFLWIPIVILVLFNPYKGNGA
jgi:hypothetical protein